VAAETDPFIDLMPFARQLGIEIATATPEEVSGRLEWRADLCTSGGVLHGGALMSLADSLGAVCAFLNLPEGASTSTIESKTNFFRAIRDGEAQATSHPLHVGRTTIVLQTDIYDSERRRVAQVTQTQAVLRKEARD
jgi:uncharacterized protein (TIGR00369 family)